MKKIFVLILFEVTLCDITKANDAAKTKHEEENERQRSLQKEEENLKLKYSPIVNDKYISNTDPEPRNEASKSPIRKRNSAVTAIPHHSSTVSYKFTTTDGLGYVHVEIGKGATTQNSLAKFPTPAPFHLDSSQVVQTSSPLRRPPLHPSTIIPAIHKEQS